MFQARRVRICLGLMLALSCVALQAEPLRVCTVLWPPHTMLAPDGHTLNGSHTELVRRTMQAAGYEIRIDAVTWERCLKDLAEGYYAAAYSASYREERALFAVYPREPIDVVRYVAVVRKGEGAGWDASRRFSALPQPISSPRGWALTEELRLHAEIVLDGSSAHNEQDIRKLLAGRVGSAIFEARTAAHLMAMHDRGQRLEILSEPVQSSRKYYLVFGRKALGDAGARQMAERFSVALAAERKRAGGTR